MHILISSDYKIAPKSIKSIACQSGAVRHFPSWLCDGSGLPRLPCGCLPRLGARPLPPRHQSRPLPSARPPAHCPIPPLGWPGGIYCTWSVWDCSELFLTRRSAQFQRCNFYANLLRTRASMGLTRYVLAAGPGQHWCTGVSSGWIGMRICTVLL